MRIIIALLALVLAACSSKTDAAPQPTTQPVAKAAEVANIVCARWAKLNPSAKCSPEYTDAGDLHTHSATVTAVADGKPVITSCTINTATPSVICVDSIIVQPAAPAPTQQPAKPGAKK